MTKNMAVQLSTQKNSPLDIMYERTKETMPFSSSCSNDQGTQEKPTYDYKHNIKDNNHEVGQGQ